MTDNSSSRRSLKVTSGSVDLEDNDVLPNSPLWDIDGGYCSGDAGNYQTRSKTFATHPPVLHFLRMRRRNLLQLISVSALSPGFDALRAAEACQAIHAGPAEPYRLRFFRPDEKELLDALMEMIIPADTHSPGAREAKVSLFADWMVSHDSAAAQREWRAGLQRMNEEARNTSLADALAKAAAGEAHPQSDLHRFFIRLKQMTVDGYYTSEVGLHRDLEYKGNDHLLKFSGCAHPEHKA